MIKKSIAFVRQEFGRLVRFGIIGILSWFLYFLIYTVLSRFLWRAGNRNVDNFIAVCLASIFNFFAHRQWTFQTKTRHIRQLIRYLLVMAGATLLEVFLFWFGHSFLHIYDLFVVIIAAGIVALFTYGFHRFYTFHHPLDLCIEKK